MTFDTSQETVIFDWIGNNEAMVRLGDEFIYVSTDKIDDNKKIGDSVSLGILKGVCSDCSSEKLYDEKNQVYYCPKCE